MCGDLSMVDRMGWMKKTEKKTSTKKDIFSIIDNNGDGEIELAEYQAFYEDIDADKNSWMNP